MTFDEYDALPDQELVERIQKAKQELGSELTILGHHYQRDEVIQFSDHRGDSLELSRRAAEASAKHIVFCGVYFMAETAAVLCDPEQTVVQPVIEALCPMAQMASGQDATAAYDALADVWDGNLTPVTYQNSISEAKALVGRHGGAVCTSSNAQRIFEWAFRQHDHILFLPDEHLGTNTALAMGIPLAEIGIWDPANPPDPSSLRDCRVVVWKGYCYVHTGFTVQHVQDARQRYPDALVVVHPECTRDVVAMADAAGSTTGIISAVEDASPGSTIVVGTEWHLVQRLAREYADRRVVPLAERTCRTMAMTRMPHLLLALERIVAGDPMNIVSVDQEIAKYANMALARMLAAS